MRGRGVLVKVILLHIFAVIALVSSKAEEPFFEDGIAAIPKRQPKANQLMPVGDTTDTVFPPAVGARTCMIVREILPSRPTRAVVFAHRAPLPLGEIRAPALPVFLAVAVFFEPLIFFGLQSGHGLEPLSGRA